MTRARTPKVPSQRIQVPETTAGTPISREPTAPGESPGMKSLSRKLIRSETENDSTPSDSIEKQQHVGILKMNGPFVAQHRKEILGLIHDTINEKDQVGIRRPPSIRISQKSAGSIKVTFTSTQMARDIGRILHQKYWGELDVKVEDEGKSVMVRWWR